MKSHTLVLNIFCSLCATCWTMERVHISMGRRKHTFLGDTNRGWLRLEVSLGITASQTQGTWLHPAISSHSAVFMTTINTLTIAVFVAQIFTSFPNESGLFFLPALSRFKERLPKIAPGLRLQQHFFLAPSLYFFLTYIKLQGLCRIQVCLVTSALKSQYHLESALTLHLDRHNIMYNSILHTNSLIHVSRKTRILTANAFLSLHASPVLHISQIIVLTKFGNLLR